MAIPSPSLRCTSLHFRPFVRSVGRWFVRPSVCRLPCVVDAVVVVRSLVCSLVHLLLAHWQLAHLQCWGSVVVSLCRVGLRGVVRVSVRVLSAPLIRGAWCCYLCVGCSSYLFPVDNRQLGVLVFDGRDMSVLLSYLVIESVSEAIRGYLPAIQCCWP